VPIIAVAGDDEQRADLRRGPVGRHVPVCRDLPSALAMAADRPPLRRAEVDLVAEGISSRQARAFVRATCLRWRVADRSQDAEEIATELVENSIIHASSDLRLRLELRDGVLTVAVSDEDAKEAVLHEPRAGQPRRGGLMLVAQLARVWGCVPRMSGGKVVWAVLAGVEGYPLPT
jgi:sirohydrochlorin ferrochelatase